MEFGTDIGLAPGGAIGGSLRLATEGGDLEPSSGLGNLAQAIWLRLAIPLGDLARLGHPKIGSRLHLLIGRLATPANIALAKAYVREALRGESRIERIEYLTVTADPGRPDLLRIDLGVRPVGAPDPLALSLQMSLEPGATGGR